MDLNNIYQHWSTYLLGNTDGRLGRRGFYSRDNVDDSFFVLIEKTIVVIAQRKKSPVSPTAAVCIIEMIDQKDGRYFSAMRYCR